MIASRHNPAPAPRVAVLTDRQREVLAAIIDHILQTGQAPTTRELADAVGIGVTAAGRFLDVLEQRGAICRWRGPDGRAAYRSITVVPAAVAAARPRRGGQ